MKQDKALFAVLLTILSLSFVVFVVFMQQKFNNPEFTDLPIVQAENVINGEDNPASSNESDDETIAGAARSLVNGDELNEEFEIDEETEQQEMTTSTRTVIAERLNVRSEPTIDSIITGMLVLDQPVEVEDSGDDWVKVITDEFTGYVNEKYLSEE